LRKTYAVRIFSHQLLWNMGIIFPSCSSPLLAGWSHSR